VLQRLKVVRNADERRSLPRRVNGAEAPTFAGLKAASAASSRAKRANRKRDTRHELLLRRTLRKLGVRFRTHDTGLPGCPDIVLRDAHVVVFCDGDFWHGRRWPTLKRALARRANADYWIAKIQANRRRDSQKRRLLRRLGWTVISFWETDIKRNPERAALTVKAILGQ
jgi:DNA mismatch endonuclease (patch repair protein)